MHTGHLIQHGEFHLAINGQILVAYARGSWNEEAALAYSEEYRAQAGRFHGHWGHLVLLDEWSLGIPEIVPVIQQLVSWSVENGLTRAAHVYSPSMLKQLQLEEMIHDGGAFIHKGFANLDDAVDWLAREGYRLDADVEVRWQSGTR
ncbi:hypothetical protein ACQUQU_12330 [Thalassolituus sp. LLYu03]|uniref:hypothetical protein n=1 Tax=Thalassolituus sp. LLYu03 TaxID=3421656 RepID=UPI003D279331